MGLTADNAAPNDTMVAALMKLIPGWAGNSNRARCFDHVVNLCARSVLKPFDAEKKKVAGVVSDAEQALQELLEGLEDDEDGVDGVDGAEADGENDDVDGFVDEGAGLDPFDREQLEDDIFPVKVLLAKVSLPKPINDVPAAEPAL